MRGILSSLIVLFTVAFIAPAFSQATVVARSRDWGTYSYQSNNGTTCYVMSLPQKMEPSSLDHGDIFFFVSPRTGQTSSYELQFIAGYNMQDNSKVIVTVGNRSFTMFSQGKSAWLENTAEESQFLAAMRAGSDMKVAATSGRGNKTGYTFSLLGFSAAMTAMQNCR